MKYYITVGGRSLEVVIDGEDVTINGRRLRAHLELPAGTPVYSARVGDRLLNVVATRGATRGAYDLALGGHRFTVEVLDARARAIRALSGAAAQQAGPAPLLAPMPGLIVRINVSAGDQVHAGQGLVVMEAMKMENELRATAAGVVKRVAVSAGSAVEKGALLLEMEE